MLKYFELIKVSFLNRIDYRQELIMSLFVGVVIFAGQVVFWKAVFSGNEIVNGFTFKQILIYFLFARIISEIIDSRLGFKISDIINDGKISNYMLKPVRIKTWLIFEEIGRLSIDVMVKTGIYILLFVIFFGSIGVSFSNVMIFIFILILSLIISLNLYFLVGCTAFITDNANGINYSLRRGILFLAGGLIPISFFPDLFQNVINVLPFRYMFDFPIKVLTGKIFGFEIISGIGVQLLWVVVLWIITEFTLNFAIKRNQSVGI